ncbi:hypothetical protein ACP70R_008147 [Stipagrostis hirtigluma subsp. patula]
MSKRPRLRADGHSLRLAPALPPSPATKTGASPNGTSSKAEREKGEGSLRCAHMALFAALLSSPPAVAAAAPRFSCSSGQASVLRVTSSRRRVSTRAIATSLSIRCEQSAKRGGGGAGAGVWLGRAAMMGFASAIAVEVSTGKGFLENFGVATPAPTLALVVSGLVVGLAVFFLLQSGSQD